MLTLEIIAEKPRYRLTDEIRLTFGLTNHGTREIVVNNRLLLGYDDDQDRELFLQIYDTSEMSGKIALPHSSDIFPKPVTLSNMQQLRPGQRIQKAIMITPVYKFPAPGSYLIRAVYRCAAFELSPELYTDAILSNDLRLAISP